MKWENCQDQQKADQLKKHTQQHIIAELFFNYYVTFDIIRSFWEQHSKGVEPIAILGGPALNRFR